MSDDLFGGAARNGRPHPGNGQPPEAYDRPGQDQDRPAATAPLDRRSADDASIDLPGPERDRWQPLRVGLRNLYRFDAEEFRFRGGRLLLRGRPPASCASRTRRVRNAPRLTG